MVRGEASGWLVTIVVFVAVFLALYVFVFKGRLTRESLNDIPATIRKAPVTQGILQGTGNVARNFQAINQDAGERLDGKKR